MSWVPWAQAGLSALGGLFGGGGESNDAVAAQAAMNREMLNMMRQQQQMENPFRRQMLQSLNARSQQQFPQFTLPQQAPVFNPFSRMSGAPRPSAQRPAGNFLSQKAQLPQAGGATDPRR